MLERNAVHLWLCCALRFLPQEPDYVYTASIDGTVCRARPAAYYTRVPRHAFDAPAMPTPSRR